MPTFSRRSLVVLGIVASALAWAWPAQAQQCGGSHLLYLVRDASGALVDADSDSFTFRGGDTNTPWRAWRPADWANPAGFPTEEMPAELLKAFRDKRTSPLSVSSRGCVFTNGAAVNVTMSGKTMELVFNVTWPCCGSRRFFVDGLPFQEGRFEITLRAPQDYRAFYPAKEWTKKPISN